MKRMILFLIVVALLMVPAVFAKDAAKTTPVVNFPVLNGDEPVPAVPYYPSRPGVITQSPGDTIGSTQYDYQSNGSSGRRVALDTDHGKHFAWMNGINFQQGTRRVYYNYIDPSGIMSWPGVGIQANQSPSAYNGAGYTQLGLAADNRAVIAYHKGTWDSLFVAVDAFPGLGSFTYGATTIWFGTEHCLWPYIAVDRSDRIHMVTSENSSPAGSVQTVGYKRSTNFGSTWTSAQRVDTVITISPVVTASPVSDKVAIVYTHPFNTTTQWKNDIYYVESTDGVTWNFTTGRTNITHYRDYPADSSCAYTDCAAVYDYNDVLHIIWNQQWVSDSAGIYFLTYLKHYASGTITNITNSDSSFYVGGCSSAAGPTSFGAWNHFICKMSIATDANNNLFATYTSWDTTDISNNGCPNGDIYMLFSVDHGTTWQGKTNLTNSQTPGCMPGECDSDHWSSMAEHADSFLHVFYVNDKDAGGVVQTEGSVTDNPMLYLRYPNPALSGITDNSPVPTTFTLSQNYPNPFNAQTKISFELKNRSEVNLSVYDVTGAKVATILNGSMAAGVHEVNWDAGNLASGVYYYSLKANGAESSKKMVLLK